MNARAKPPLQELGFLGPSVPSSQTPSRPWGLSVTLPCFSVWSEVGYTLLASGQPSHIVCHTAPLFCLRDRLTVRRSGAEIKLRLQNVAGVRASPWTWVLPVPPPPCPSAPLLLSSQLSLETSLSTLVCFLCPFSELSQRPPTPSRQHCGDGRTMTSRGSAPM